MKSRPVKITPGCEIFLWAICAKKAFQDQRGYPWRTRVGKRERAVSVSITEWATRQEFAFVDQKDPAKFMKPWKLTEKGRAALGV